ncbi:MAG: hypothetical protein K2X27_11950 [Candidatus Obscuribacterales bacterium]|nr:hypothetical protein [Candidatus Obscuribacterales bacterium]
MDEIFACRDEAKLENLLTRLLSRSFVIPPVVSRPPVLIQETNLLRMQLPSRRRANIEGRVRLRRAQSAGDSQDCARIALELLKPPSENIEAAETQEFDEENEAAIASDRGSGPGSSVLKSKSSPDPVPFPCRCCCCHPHKKLFFEWLWSGRQILKARQCESSGNLALSTAETSDVLCVLSSGYVIRGSGKARMLVLPKR